MTDRELMQQALEALDAYSWEQVQVATNALRDRLAQPEQELVIDCPRCGHCCPKSNQEPVAWQGVHDHTDLYYRKPPQADVRPLYTAPRPWVGLTNDEANKFAAGCHLGKSVQSAIREAEARLKEKNT